MKRALLALAIASTAVGGEIDVKGSLGWVGFLDDSPQNHLLAGGSGRFYLTRRLSVEPEFQYLRQSAAHHDWVILPNVAWDFRSGRIRPYVTGGAGLLRFVQRFPGAPPGSIPGFSVSQWHISAGFGTKIYVQRGWFVAPEFRVGWEPHARFSVGVGYTFTR